MARSAWNPGDPILTDDGLLYHEDATPHGTERGFRQVTRSAAPSTLTTGRTLTLWSESHPEGEKFCAKCQKWQAQRGILATVFGCPECGAAW